MNDKIQDVVKLGVDCYHGDVSKYSTEDGMETLKRSLIEANGGSEELTFKSMRDNPVLFSIIEEILSRTVVEGLTGDEFFMQMVDFRNVSLGDTNRFLVEDSTLFRVDEIAEGHQGIRRQRLEGLTEYELQTRLYAVKIYEELNRVLAGRVNFNFLINKVAESYRKQILDDICAAYMGMTADDFGGLVYFPAAGNYDEDALLDVIAHVEATANGSQATILGTKKALRKLAPSIQGHDSKNDLYNIGYYGRFYGSNTFMIPQRHKTGTTDFIMPDNELIILANTTEKPIKMVYEGDPMIIQGDPLLHGDLTMTYAYLERYGIGVVASTNAGIGKYVFDN